MKYFAAGFLMLMASGCFLPSPCQAQEPFPAREIQFDGIFGLRPGAKAIYCLLGTGFFRAPSSQDSGSLITSWLAAHPAAQAIPVTVSHDGMVYTMVQDGEENLNVTLIRAGAFPGSVMVDTVDLFLISGHRTGEPPRRIMPEQSYRAYLSRIAAAEADARASRRGIWGELDLDGERRER